MLLELKQIKKKKSFQQLHCDTVLALHELIMEIHKHEYGTKSKEELETQLKDSKTMQKVHLTFFLLMQHFYVINFILISDIFENNALQ